MRQVYTCSVLGLLAGRESVFIFMHFVGAWFGWNMPRYVLVVPAYQPTRCVWVNFTSSDLVSMDYL